MRPHSIMRFFLIIMICASIFVWLAGCSTHQGLVVEERGYLERCVIENLILESSHNGKLPLNIALVENFKPKKIYRSGKLRAELIPNLARLGIKSIVTLSSVSDETREAIKEYGIRHEEFGYISTGMTYEGIKAAIDQIMAFPEPVLVHCRAGADRTGIVIAALRASYGETDREALMEEMRLYCHVTFNKYLYYEDLLDKFIDVYRQTVTSSKNREDVRLHRPVTDANVSNQRTYSKP